MLCRNPYLDQFACGQCVPCKLKKRKEWTGRILLELKTAPQALFLTLTYAPKELRSVSIDNPLPTLYPNHLTAFLHRLRKSCGKIRYFAVGEYGTESDRPHYHAIVFAKTFPDTRAFEKLWPHGFVSLSLVNEARAAYIAQYALKKLTKADNPRLQGRYPEFARQSRKPPLGWFYAERIANMYQTSSGSRYIAQQGDVLPVVKLGAKNYPLGKSILAEIRGLLSIPLSLADRIALNPNAQHIPRVDWEDLSEIEQDMLDSINHNMDKTYEKALSQNLQYSRL